ncbi:hypothetical protein [Sulfurospirillum arcachonense]|uniref:hypothetical protein n=1 Tax=Sulfurospirillum arcachonense TaxID=57666 RepID=UPI00046A1BF0|nr:hypothetical protein [Sulfurospirillum arcachonense]
MQKVVILGTGWLGFPLAKHLSKNNYDVLASFRNRPLQLALNREKINSFYVDLNEDTLSHRIFDTDVLCILIPPSKNENYQEIFNKLVSHEKFHKIKQIIFASSTSVYEDTPDAKDEESPTKANNQIVQTEMIFNKFQNVAILRFAGLMGKERYLRKYYTDTIENSQSIVNHIHLEDAIGIIKETIAQNLTGTYNVCAPMHPTKKEIIQEQCYMLNQKECIFKNGNSKKHLVLTDKIDKKLFYMYKHPNPIYFPLIKNQEAF